MKWQLLIWLCISISVHAQEAIISSDMMNVLYVGMLNPITVSVNGTKPEDLEVAISGKTNRIQPVSPGKYVATVSGDTGACTIAVSLKKNGALIRSCTYAIREVPAGYALYGELESGSYTLKNILRQDRMVYRNDAYLGSVGENFRILKFNVTTISKSDCAYLFGCRGDTIPIIARKHLSNLHIHDIILIDGIKVKILEAEILMPPITLSIVTDEELKHKGTVVTAYRKEGYLFIDGKRRYYRYPSGEFSADCDLAGHIKDSTWTYSGYSEQDSVFKCYRQDSFSMGKLVKTVNYLGNTVDFSLLKLNDSLFRYTSFYRSGKVYQAGNVLVNSKYRRYNIYYYYENAPTRKPVHEQHLSNVHSGYYPNGEWDIFDSLGHKVMNVHYVVVYDSNPAIICDFGSTDYSFNWQTQSNYLIVPNGKCTFYKPDGKVEKAIWFKDGKEIK